MSEYVTLDSGKREAFPTGSLRDTREGKGRYDLIPPHPLERLAGVYERGAAKYGDRNWELGQPVSRSLDSAVRHVFKHLEGHRDEDHLAQAAWNLFAAIHVEEMVARGLLPLDLIDLASHLPTPAPVEVDDRPTSDLGFQPGCTFPDCGCSNSRCEVDG